MKLFRAHLVPLLNALHRLDTTHITVSHPCEEIGELFEITLGHPAETTIRLTKDIGDYRDARQRVLEKHSEQAFEDLPDAEAYVRGLTAAGIVPLANEEDLQAYVRQHGYRDLEAGHEPIVLGLDTNIITFELPRVLGLDHRTGQRDRHNRRPTNGYALATGVKEELDWHYKHYNTASLIDAFGSDFSRLSNQPAGSNREGFLGLYAYRKLMATRNTDRVKSDTGDDSIIEGYCTYRDESRKTPLLLSNDYGFIESAVEQGLLAHHVSFTPVLPRTVDATWQEITDALYLMSVLFGVLRLPKVTLLGVWDGKSGTHWQNEALIADCRSPKVEPLLERQMRVIDAYNS